jgi:hypothetical protein
MRDTAKGSTSEPTTICGTELLKLRPRPTRWGRWRLNRRYDTLEFHGDDGYMTSTWPTSSAACLGRIFQVSRKTWMTNEDRGRLCRRSETP